MTARETILSAIRRVSPGGDGDSIAAEALALLADPDSIRPAPAGATLHDAFAAKASVLGTTVERIPDLASVPQAVRRYLDSHGLQSLSLQPAPDLTALDWTGIAIHEGVAPDEPAALGLALFGVAESGSVVIHSGPDAPILLSFLPLHHIVVLRESTLLPYLEDYAAKLAATDTPRNAILITGPSGTTDIEGSYVRGAHGPGFLHVVMVRDAGGGQNDMP